MSLKKVFHLQYCVASNSLAAITYWCQGKEYCKFQPKWLITSIQNTHQYLFYLQNQGKPVKNYLEAVESCQELGSLAKLENLEKAQKALKLISRTNSTKVEGYWIDAYTKEHFKDLKISGASGHMQDSCLVLISDLQHPQVLNIQWESCYESKKKYGALCEAHLHSKIFGDNSCFEDLEDQVLEYRIHFGKNLNGRDVSCPMDGILMRRGNTCYKTTDVTDWPSARAQCWSWGGELAFTLPGSDPECAAPVPGVIEEEVKFLFVSFSLVREDTRLRYFE